ncbi:MAG: hypothetical protein AAF889_00070 [Cyanobacteria bacterium P01_D01_bin.73]
MKSWITLLALLLLSCDQNYSSQSGFLSEIIDGETLVVQINGQNQPVKLCGVSPKPGAKAELEKLVSFGDQVVVLGSDNQVEIFIPTDSELEIHLNAELLLRGLAAIDESDIDRCPNQQSLRIAAEGLDTEANK